MTKPLPYYLVCILLALPILSSAQTSNDSTTSKWEFGLEGYYYIIPSSENTFTFISRADHKRWHFEGRYNYEGEKTGSVFAGYKFTWSGKVEFELTPMLGMVFGNTNGIAPALEMDFSFWKLDYYSESEYVFDFAGSENNYFYTWAELSVEPLKSFSTGLAFQRTLLYETKLDVQRGIFARYNFKSLTAGFFAFNPFSSQDYFIATLGIEF